MVIAEGIDLEVTPQRVAPVQPTRAGSLLLPEKEKDGSRDRWLSSWRHQPEVAHGVLVAARDVLREKSDKIRWRARALNYRLRSGVLILIDDLVAGDA